MSYTKCFFLDAADNKIERPEGDEFRSFIEGTILNIGVDFRRDKNDKLIDHTGISSSKSYTDILDALGIAKSLYSGTANDQVVRDRFAALILLKNKCGALLRESVKMYIQQHARDAGQTVAQWLQDSKNENKVLEMINGADYVDASGHRVKFDGWRQLMEQIDAEIDNIVKDSTYAHLKLGTERATTTVDELSLYQMGADHVAIANKPQLTR